MAMVTRETSGLEARVDKNGRIRLWHMGHRLPLSSISIDAGGFGLGGVMNLTLLTRFVTFVHEEEESDAGL